MRIALIGMAGSGKSYWSKRLKDVGFIRFCCDDMIAQRLRWEITQAGFDEGAVAEWMGFPYEQHYRDRERRYLECERQVMEEILEQISENQIPSDSDIVIDTTGSVIYVGDDILRELRRYVNFVLLSTPPEVQERLLSDYISKPHPMVWRDFFDQRPGESPLHAMKRCYPRLFEARRILYEKYADLCIDYYERRSKGFDALEFIRRIRNMAKEDKKQ